MSDLKTQVKDTDMVVLSSKFADSVGIVGQPVKTVAGSNMMIPVMTTAKTNHAPYEKVADGIYFSTAINKTKREFISGKYGQDYQHPLYWAPYVYYGN